MIKLEWIEAFEIGVPEIDQDHRELVDFLSKIQQNLLIGDEVRCKDDFTSFTKACKKHFIREETILENADYPNVEEHRAQHQQLLNLANEILEQCEMAHDPEKLQVLFEGLVDFLLGDVIRADIHCKSHMQERGFSKQR